MRFLYININYNTLIFVYFMKKYEEPQMKLHELRTKTSMLESSPEKMHVDTKTSTDAGKNDLEDFESATLTW